MKHLKQYEEYSTDRPELINSIREYLLNEYPESWWNIEFNNRVNDYISMDDIVGDGDEEDESTWDYQDEEEAYRELSTGGAIEYDILEEIRRDITDKFHITDDEYYNLGINEIVEEHMCNMIDWYDHFIFGKNKKDLADPFGFNKGVKDLMDRMDKLDHYGDIKL